METLANLTFLQVEDPKCNVRYLNKSRPRIVYEGHTGSSCALFFGDRIEEVFAGDEVEVEIALIVDIHAGMIKKGLEFELFAGTWKIAKGIFTFVDEFTYNKD